MKKSLLILGIAIGIIGAFYLIVYADSSGPNYATTAVDDSSVGTKVWSNPQNASGTIDNVYATWAGSSGGNTVENSIKIVKGGTISGTEKSTGINFAPTASAIQSYGTSTDLWGLSWTASDVNASTFGFAFSIKDTNNNIVSHYLKVAGYGFAIPANATINGIFAEVVYANISGGAQTMKVDAIRITIYYTPTNGGPQQLQVRSGKIQVKTGRINIKN